MLFGILVCLGERGGVVDVVVVVVVLMVDGMGEGVRLVVLF